jgi:hypothetical protein
MGAAGGAGSFFLECLEGLDCCAQAKDANASAAVKSGATKAKRCDLTLVLKEFGSERRSRVAPILSSVLP